MVAPVNRVPPTYRKRAFIPDGYVDVLGALSIVGKALFGDKWTGEEIDARSPAQRPAEAEEQHRREDEARQRRDEAAQWLQQWAFARKGSSKVITKGGTVHDLPERVWGDENAWQIFDRGTAGFAELADYDVVTIEGHVLFLEQEVRDALSAGAAPLSSKNPCSADNEAPAKSHQSGEPKPKTIKVWKEDYDSVIHFLMTEKTVADAARKAALSPPRRWATIVRNYNRFKSEHLDRQIGKSPNT